MNKKGEMTGTMDLFVMGGLMVLAVILLVSCSISTNWSGTAVVTRGLTDVRMQDMLALYLSSPLDDGTVADAFSHIAEENMLSKCVIDDTSGLDKSSGPWCNKLITATQEFFTDHMHLPDQSWVIKWEVHEKKGEWDDVGEEGCIGGSYCGAIYTALCCEVLELDLPIQRKNHMVRIQFAVPYEVFS